MTFPSGIHPHYLTVNSHSSTPRRWSHCKATGSINERSSSEPSEAQRNQGSPFRPALDCASDASRRAGDCKTWLYCIYLSYWFILSIGHWLVTWEFVTNHFSSLGDRCDTSFMFFSCFSHFFPIVPGWVGPQERGGALQSGRCLGGSWGLGCAWVAGSIWVDAKGNRFGNVRATMSTM